MTKKHNSWFLVIIFLVGVSSLVFVGLFSYKLIKSFTSGDPTDKMAAQWQSHTDAKHRYQFRYPSEKFMHHIAAEDSDGETLLWSTHEDPLKFEPGTLAILMYIGEPKKTNTEINSFYSGDLSLKELLESSYERSVELKDITTSGVPGVVYKGSENDLLHSATWFKDGKLFTLTLTAESQQTFEGQEQLFDQILSSFEFLD